MKTIYTYSLRLLTASMVFMLLQTIFFMFLYGWHWDLYAGAEEICYTVAIWGLRIGACGWLWCVVKIIDAIMEAADFEPRKPLNP